MPIASGRWINEWKMICKSWVVPWLRQFFRRPLTLEVRVCSQATSSEISGGEKGIGIGFFLNTADFFLSVFFHNAPQCSTLTHTFAIRFKLRHRASVNNAFNTAKTKPNLLYIRNQSVPRCKHFPPRL